MLARAPLSLRLEPLEEGLRFRDAVVETHLQQRATQGKKVGVDLPFHVARLVFVSLILIVVVLGIMVFSLVFLGARASSSVSYYYEVTQPYLEEVRDRGMHMIRNADSSSESMRSILAGADGAAARSVPALEASLNETAAAVDRLARLAKNPVLKLSMGEA